MAEIVVLHPGCDRRRCADLLPTNRGRFLALDLETGLASALVPAHAGELLLSGRARDLFSYASVEQQGPHEWVAACGWVRNGLRLRVEDVWREGNTVALARRLIATPVDAGPVAGLRLQLTVLLPASDDDELRFCCPARVYNSEQHDEPRTYVLADERLSSPLVLRWAGKDGDAVTLVAQ